MNETKIKVPEGMLQAGRAVYSGYVTAEEGARRILIAALRWLSENPVVPTDCFMRDMLNRDFFGGDNWNDPQVIEFCVEWQRRMFCVPEQEYIGEEKLENFCCRYQRIDEAVREAYRLGQESK